MFARERESEGERKQRQPNPSTINGIDKFQGGLGRFCDQKLRVAVQINKNEKHCTNLLSLYFSLRSTGAEMRALLLLLIANYSFLFLRRKRVTVPKRDMPIDHKTKTKKRPIDKKWNNQKWTKSTQVNNYRTWLTVAMISISINNISILIACY